MKQKIILFPLLLLLTGSLFGMTAYGDNVDDTSGSDEGRYENVEAAQSQIVYEFELGTIWGYDFETEQSGFKEIIDLDFKYIFNRHTNYKSDLGGIDYDKPYGELEVSGMSVETAFENKKGDQEKDLPMLVDINYELIYGRIMFDPFYLLVAASEEGNRYSRNHGYTFSRGTSSIRANVAHIGYNVPWSGEMILQGPYADGGAWNSVNEIGAAALLGLGYIFGATEMMLQVGSEKDWKTNENNEYQIGFQIESNPVGNLTLKANGFTGVNYDIMPINFGVGAGYRYELNDTLALVPFVAYDHTFIGKVGSPTDSFKSEITAAVSLVWPGGIGWGYEPLNDTDLNRYSGLTVGTDITTVGDNDPKAVLVISSFEETSGGLVPNLGASVVVEIDDLTNTKDLDYKRIAFGVYLDYNVMDILKPFVRTTKTSGLEESPILFESGIEYTAIPNTIITVGFDTADISDLENNKGLFYTEFKVVL